MNEAKKRKKKAYSSCTYTTGDPGYNIKQFNKHMGTDFEDEIGQKAQKAAEQAAKAIGTIAAASPDGGSSVTPGDGIGAGDASGESSGISEELELNEDKFYVAKYDQDFELPENIKILDKAQVEAELEKLEPEEEFEVGYVTPVYFYKELMDRFTLLKCTQLAGYTGIDYIEARADDEGREERRQISKAAIALGSDKGKHLDRQPWARETGDFSAKYASTNKTVLQDNGNTLLFYPKIGTKPKVLYYLDLHNGIGYMPVRRDQLERTILKYVESFIGELTSGVKKDGTPRKMSWDDKKLAAKIQKQLETDAKTISAVTLDKENNMETRSRLSNGIVEKPQVRALYTGQIYYLKSAGKTLGVKLIEGFELTEAKRYVRRYYIRPQNVFCSNKTDIINALIEFEDQNCTIYTLNNLGDVKDVTKLTNNDIIYYYDDRILYDKNHVRIMDYDLYIKHEEQRRKINVDTASDAVLSDVYKDRLTGMSDLDEDGNDAFHQEFADVNAYGEKLKEGKEIDGECCICGEPIEGYGNNAEPYAKGRCCDACNLKFVIPARLEAMGKGEGR